MPGDDDPRSVLPQLHEFLEEWREDRREGRTTRVLHQRVESLDGKLDTHLTEYQQRVTALETNAERDAEARAVHGGNTGSFRIVPVAGGSVAGGSGSSNPPARRSSSSPWYAREPFKTAAGYGAAVAVASVIGWSTHAATTSAGGSQAVAVPRPQLIEELPRMSAPGSVPEPNAGLAAAPMTTIMAPAPRDAGRDARGGHVAW